MYQYRGANNITITKDTHSSMVLAQVPCMMDRAVIFGELIHRNDSHFPDSCNDGNVVAFAYAFVTISVLVSQFTAFNWLHTIEMAFIRMTHDWSEVLALLYCRERDALKNFAEPELEL
ncbi:hypothetical protein BofuT4_P100010.1 [Botrytis cinerea T4]|uniref:Uncharacterized protein n=1 Tax=Botryotinia fuckeliana (strain T4) TaxID=999810 RepID=G2YC50_BOTF4|nr:hypothetical protein BofuT4_P100010.1 [Botrytis cinerea T4]